MKKIKEFFGALLGLFLLLDVAYSALPFMKRFGLVMFLNLVFIMMINSTSVILLLAGSIGLWLLVFFLVHNLVVKIRKSN